MSVYLPFKVDNGKVAVVTGGGGVVRQFCQGSGRFGRRGGGA